jgi:hypothetical protein
MTHNIPLLAAALFINPEMKSSASYFYLLKIYPKALQFNFKKIEYWQAHCEIIPICIRGDDPAFGRVPRTVARSPTRKRVPGRTWGYVEESDSGASCKDAATTKVYT